MGVDLTIVPLHFDPVGTVYPFTQLALDRDSVLWSAIEALPLSELECAMYWIVVDEGENEVLGVTTEDAYGSPLKWVRAVYLESALRAHGSNPLGRELSPQNLAVLAFLKACDPSRRVILYWH